MRLTLTIHGAVTSCIHGLLWSRRSAVTPDLAPAFAPAGCHPKNAPNWLKLLQKPQRPPEAPPNRFRPNPPIAKADPSSTEVAFNRANPLSPSQKPFSKTFLRGSCISSQTLLQLHRSPSFASHSTAQYLYAPLLANLGYPTPVHSFPRPAPLRAMLRGG